MTTPKQRKNAKKKEDSSQKPLLNVSEDEQWRLINETGVLHKVAERNGDQEPPLLLAILMSIPLTVLHGGLDYVVHQQYDFLDQFTVRRVLTRQLPLFPLLVAFIYFTTKYKRLWVAQGLFTIGSIAAGNYLVYLSTDDQTFGAMLKTPGLALLWIYFVIQMNLPLGCLSLLGTYAYYHKEWFEGAGMGKLKL
ncbi:hypothetical protein HK104_003280 [Borealophlyctis nickersoniae]|nr:hypothetical protein HK104_003280 [Borealophlyctis nickersoniae]